MTDSRLAELNEQILQLQKERETLIASQRAEIIRNLQSQIQAYSITPRELFTVRGYSKRPKSKEESVKYRSKTNEKHTWSGRGKTPKWVYAHLNAGGTIEELKVSPEQAQS